MNDATVARDSWTGWPVWDLRVLEPADGRVVGLAVAAGVAFDAGLRSGIASVGGTIAVLVGGGALLVSGRLRTGASRACVTAASVLGIFFSLRTSEWLLALNLLGASGLLVLAGILAREGRTFDLPARLLAARVILTLGHGAGAAAFLLVPVRRLFGSRAVSASTAAVVRGVALAVPLLLLLGALLASADAVFASALQFSLPMPDDAAGHLVLVVVGALAVGGVLRTASSTTGGEVPVITRRLGPVEWTIVLSGLVTLFSAFAIAQVVTLAGGARHVLKTEGLTYAEYARTGYVQLIAVAGLAGLALAGLSAVASMPSVRSRRRFTVLAELTVALTGVILAVAVRRLGLYEEAYGWTMLRLVSKAGAIWLGVVLVLAAMRLAGFHRHREWLLPAALAAGFVIVLVLNAINPEAIVARHNLGLPREIDPAYLATRLSDDALPTIVESLPSLDVAEGERLRSLVCATDAGSDARSGLLSWNRSARAAEAALARAC